MPPNNPKNGGNFGIVMLFIIVIVVILLIAAAVGILMLSPGSASDPSEQSGSADAESGQDDDPAGTDPGEGDSGAEGVAAEGLEDYEGTWDGDLIQYDENDNAVSTWSATVTVEGGRISAMEYGLGNLDDGECTWSLSDVQPSDTELSFSYTVADDMDCADNGEVVLEFVDNDSLDITVISVLSPGVEHTSEGTLFRQ